MQYVTTFDTETVYEPRYTLHNKDRQISGLFIPKDLPVWTPEEVEALRDKPFGQCVAEVLNQLFDVRMDSWDVDFCVGRYPFKIVAMSHKIILAETWHNPDWDFSRMVRNLNSRLRGTEDSTDKPASWAWIGIRIAVLFGIFGQLERNGAVDTAHPLDVAVPSGFFSSTMAAWYARKMGLPVGRIISGCSGNDTPWTLFNYGEIRQDVFASMSEQPTSDVAIPAANLERLIACILGADEAKKYREASFRGEVYRVPDGKLEEVRDGMYASVVSQGRMEDVIAAVSRTSTYLLDPDAAVAYGALQDFRSSYSDGRSALILSEQNPALKIGVVAKAIGVSEQELLEDYHLN